MLKICFVGNMLGEHEGYVTTQGEILGKLFEAAGCYEVTLVSSKINRVARLLDVTARILLKRQIDLVVLDAYSGSYFFLVDLVCRYCKLRRIPLIVVLHGGQLPDFSRRFPNWVTRVFNRADAVVAPSEFLADEFAKQGLKEVHVIPNVVDMDIQCFKERSDILPRLLWMRSFHPIYNPEMALKVLAKLRAHQPAATLTMAGQDKGCEEAIREQAIELGLQGAVKFPGFLNQRMKEKLMSEADIYINTNHIDNMPVSVVEARSFGLPVIATSVGGIPYMIEDGHNGFLVPNNDADAMVEKILLLLGNTKLTKMISRNGFAAAKFSSWELVKKQWEDLMLATLDRYGCR